MDLIGLDWIRLDISGLDLIGLDWIRYIYQSKVIQVSKNAAFSKEDCVAIKDNALL